MIKTKWVDSIYEQKGSKGGLTIKDGMLLNNTSCSTRTLIDQAVQAKKMRKRAEKVSIMSEAIMIGNMVSR